MRWMGCVKDDLNLVLYYVYFCDIESSVGGYMKRYVGIHILVAYSTSHLIAETSIPEFITYPRLLVTILHPRR